MLLKYLPNRILSYAEMHFNPFKIWSGKIYRPIPEIIFDIPFRFNYIDGVPVFMLVKDAHKFPVVIESITLQSNVFSETIHLNRNFNHKMHWEKFEFKIQLDTNQLWAASIFFTIKSERNNYSGKYCNDTYLLTEKIPFLFYAAQDPFPGSDIFYWSDLHAHSHYTRDIIEFGSPISMMAHAASAIGLDFFAVTDHSYDLDDFPENSMKNDPDLNKYTSFLNEVGQNNYPSIPIRGEEASLGSSKKANIHLLILNQQQFYPGFGDSGERLCYSKPTHNLEDAFEQKKNEEIFIAAHPLKKSKLSHQYLLGRDSWPVEDLQHPKLDGWQILNGNHGAEFESGKKLWIQSLLKGQQKFIVAGNDSHGNLNIFRQIIFPLFSMQYNYKNQFGRYRTGVLKPPSLSKSRDHFLSALKNGKSIVTNGPSVFLEIRSDQHSFTLGDTVWINEPQRFFKLSMNAESTVEFGSIREIQVLHGILGSEKEFILYRKTFPENSELFTFTSVIPLNLPKQKGYLRAEVYSGNSNLALTNPIWIDVK